MFTHKRNLILDIFDPAGNKICNIYNNNIDVSGQAKNVTVTTERNGWRELSFELPTKIHTENGEEDNFRQKKIIADFKIRLIDDSGTDWFIITNPSQSHSGFSKNINVTAGHICQILKTKNLGLEFNDEEGNNVGTAQTLLDTILDGTGWVRGYCDTFYEKYETNTVKQRSLNAAAKSGAYKLISSMCELFEAKPIYHGEGYAVLTEEPDDWDTDWTDYYVRSSQGKYTNISTAAAPTFEDNKYYYYRERVVDIIHMNPFSSDLDVNGLPDLSRANGVIELNYGNNIENISRNINSENLVTTISAYGSYGDDTSGYCDLQSATHKEYKFTLGQNIIQGAYYDFYITDNMGVALHKVLKASYDIASGNTIVYSIMDPSSMLYMWWNKATSGNTTVGNKIAGRVLDYDSSYTISRTLTYTTAETKANNTTYICDYTYYNDNGVLSDEMLAKIAEYQVLGAEANKTVVQTGTELSNALTDLHTYFIGTNFAKLAISTIGNQSNYVSLNINTSSDEYGFIYRSDNSVKWKKRFKVTACDAINPLNGLPVSGAPSLVIIYNNTNNKWIKGYVKAISENETDNIINRVDIWIKTDDADYATVVTQSTALSELSFYLVQSISYTGLMGDQESSAESTMIAINKQTERAGYTHPVYFDDKYISLTYEQDDSIIDFSQQLESGSDYIVQTDYAWLWKWNETKDNRLFFNCPSMHKPTSNNWDPVLYGQTLPNTATDGTYFYKFGNGTSELYLRSNSQWVHKDSDEQETIKSYFGGVIKAGCELDKIYEGIYSKYDMTTSSALASGYYCVDDGYTGYYTFHLINQLSATGTLTINTNKGYVYKTYNGTTELLGTYDSKPYDSVCYYPSDFADNQTMENGIEMDASTGVETNRTGYSCTGYIFICPGIDYALTVKKSGALQSISKTICFFDKNKDFISGTSVLAQNINTFTAPSGTRYVKISVENQNEDDLTVSIGLNLNVSLDDSDVINYKFYTYDNGDIINYKLLTFAQSQATDVEFKSLKEAVKQFTIKADTAYVTKTNAYNTAVETKKALLNSLTDTLGDIYREGSWVDQSYTEEDIQKMYYDALDLLKENSHPEVTYSIKYIDLYESNEDDYATSNEAKSVSWPDLDIASAAHQIDDELNINQWAYIDKIKKCYDLPQNTQISIDTKLSTSSQHSLSDVLTNIANTASILKDRESVYRRAENINSDGTYNTDLLEGTISANKTKFDGGRSNWYTDEFGNIVFESGDGTSAMTQSGNGFCIANSKDVYDNWNWRTFGTGDGFTADQIVAGKISSDIIEAGSINADKINVKDLFTTNLSVAQIQMAMSQPSGINMMEGCLDLWANNKIMSTVIDSSSPSTSKNYIRNSSGEFGNNNKWTVSSANDTFTFGSGEGYHTSGVNFFTFNSVGNGNVINDTISTRMDYDVPTSINNITYVFSGYFEFLTGSESTLFDNIAFELINSSGTAITPSETSIKNSSGTSVSGTASLNTWYKFESKYVRNTKSTGCKIKISNKASNTIKLRISELQFETASAATSWVAGMSNNDMTATNKSTIEQNAQKVAINVAGEDDEVKVEITKDKIYFDLPEEKGDTVWNDNGMSIGTLFVKRLNVSDSMSYDNMDFPFQKMYTGLPNIRIEETNSPDEEYKYYTDLTSCFNELSGCFIPNAITIQICQDDDTSARLSNTTGAPITLTYDSTKASYTLTNNIIFSNCQNNIIIDGLDYSIGNHSNIIPLSFSDCNCVEFKSSSANKTNNIVCKNDTYETKSTTAINFKSTKAYINELTISGVDNTDSAGVCIYATGSNVYVEDSYDMFQSASSVSLYLLGEKGSMISIGGDTETGMLNTNQNKTCIDCSWCNLQTTGERGQEAEPVIPERTDTTYTFSNCSIVNKDNNRKQIIVKKDNTSTVITGDDIPGTLKSATLRLTFGSSISGKFIYIALADNNGTEIKTSGVSDHKVSSLTSTITITSLMEEFKGGTGKSLVAYLRDNSSVTIISAILTVKCEV